MLLFASRHTATTMRDTTAISYFFYKSSNGLSPAERAFQRKARNRSLKFQPDNPTDQDPRATLSRNPVALKRQYISFARFVLSADI
jgi:hypothetical protein